MPSKTFLNLSREKRAVIINACLREFAVNAFSVASTNTIVKKLGISRGSIYKYFEDKEDLWLYLKTFSEEKKLAYNQALNRSDYSDFWEYLKAAYGEGMKFDRDWPLCSKFLYQIHYKDHSPEIQQYTSDWKEKARLGLVKMVEMEQESGSISQTINAETAALFIISIGGTLVDLLQNYMVPLNELTDGESGLLSQHMDAYEKAVHEIINLLKNALN